MENKFSNKVAIVTGGASGIGKAIAYRLGREGATLAIFDFNKALLHEAVKEFKNANIPVKGYLVDISIETQEVKTVSQVEKDWGKIDILVNAAGIVGPTSTKITDFSTSDFDRLYEVNLNPHCS